MRYRLYPTRAQEQVLREHCAHARFVWNLGLEQRLEYRPGRGPTPTYFEQKRQLTEARAAEPWLAAGSATVQQEALRDLNQAWWPYVAGTRGKPTWRKAGIDEGFRIVGAQARRVEHLNRRWSAALIPKVGWVKFRRSRQVPDAKSYRVKLNRAGQWHIAFAAIPDPIPAPGNGGVVGIDRGVAVSAALSTGEMLSAPRVSPARRRQEIRAERRLRRAKRGSARRAKARLTVARLRSRAANARKDWAEKTSTDIARRFDVIRVEDLQIPKMVRSAKGTVDAPGSNVRAKAGLNREIARSGWGLLVRRLDQKAPKRVERINPAFTSQRCSACGHIAAESRKSQALFACVACNFVLNADVNAARNIAAGHAVNARGGDRDAGPVNREPQLVALGERNPCKQGGCQQ